MSQGAAGELKKGSVVTCEVIEVKEGGIDVEDRRHRSRPPSSSARELARDRGDQRPERFAVGQKVDARVTQFDRKTHKVARLDQGAGSGGGEGSDRPVRLRRFGRLARRHPRRCAQAARRIGRRQSGRVRLSGHVSAQSPTPGLDPGVFHCEMNLSNLPGFQSAASAVPELMVPVRDFSIPGGAICGPRMPT